MIRMNSKSVEYQIYCSKTYRGGWMPSSCGGGAIDFLSKVCVSIHTYITQAHISTTKRKPLRNIKWRDACLFRN